jgi:NAD(P)-dependent dehydrogenase (short-subunit alcohol dehydrogenase family)
MLGPADVVKGDDVAGRLQGKRAIVVGAGQTPGQTIGNGRATALLYAREGAHVLLVDRDLDSARETQAMIEAEGGRALSHQGDVVSEADCRVLAEAAVEALGGVDVLHNNVGVGAGDSGVTSLAEEVWDHILDVNLKGTWFTCKHVLPVMRRQRGGAIVNISSIAAVAAANIVAYKVSKAGVNALTRQIAVANARFGVRANAVMPGLMNTPMAIEGISRARHVDREALIRERDAQVPLGKMGTAWDVAYASLYLASDEARFVTGALLPVDGGQTARVG